MPATELDQIVNLCKRRGFVYPSAEIYGGFRSTYDYGPLGSLMLRNVKNAWVRSMVQQRDDVVLIDAAILGPPQVWEASGHLGNFSDPLVDCTNCKTRHRLDKKEIRLVRRWIDQGADWPDGPAGELRPPPEAFPYPPVDHPAVRE